MGHEAWREPSPPCPELLVGTGFSERPYADEILDCGNPDLAYSGTVAFMNASTLRLEQTIAGMRSPENYHPYSTSCENGELHVFLPRDHCWEEPGDPGVIRKACVVHLHAAADDVDEEGKVQGLSGWAHYWVCHYEEGSAEPFECPLDCTANPGGFTAWQP
jgi:hypothetical protein